MKVYFERKVLGGFFLALIILTLLGIFSYRNNKNSMATSQRVSNANQILYHIEQLHSNNFELEAELQRFAINADTAFVTFYKNQLAAARDHYSTVRELTKENPYQQIRIDSIRVLGRKKVDLINQIIMARRHSEDSVRKLIPSAYNRSLLKRINRVIEEMQSEEKRLLDLRMQATRKEIAKFNATFTTLLIVTGSIIVVLFIAINSTLKARLQAEQRLQSASQEVKDLYHNAPCGYHSLNADGIIVEMNKTWFEWIGYEREEVINKLNFFDLLTPKSQAIYQKHFIAFKEQGFVNNLEFEIIRKNTDTLMVIVNATAIFDEEGKFLKSRATAFDITDRQRAEQKVVEANKELEAFTYSVSHDLRAPLRSIDGYSKILQEDYASKMDVESGRLLQIVRRNASRMGQLIDDLLDFSRLGRKELSLSVVHMNSLVENIKEELMALEKNSEVQFTIHKLEESIADLNMIRQVWVNLISNALKYSHKQSIPKIEIGCKKERGQVVYYIRDNGVGFDMKYSDKLFGVFQRLHKLEEFEGTGVGLALAHRIVMRHGGKIWAEAEVDEGATFFFFIPKLNLNL